MIPALYDKGYIVSYKEGDIALYRTPLPVFPNGDDKYHVVAEGDTLLSIAQKYYDNQFLWYIIADMNPVIIEDIFQLTVNTTLLIPNLNTIQLIYG